MIKMLSEKIFNEYIDNYVNKREQEIQGDLFVMYDKKHDIWVACDNSTGDCWVEEFKNLDMACNWLLGKFEV